MTRSFGLGIKLWAKTFRLSNVRHEAETHLSRASQTSDFTAGLSEMPNNTNQGNVEELVLMRIALILEFLRNLL